MRKKRKLTRLVTGLQPWDPLAFSPWVNDPVAQYLAAVYRGAAPTPHGHKLFSVQDLAIEITEDDVVQAFIAGQLDTMRRNLQETLEDLREYRLRVTGIAPRSLGRKVSANVRRFQTGGCVDGEVDRYFLRIPESRNTMEIALSRVLDAGVGFPEVARQVRFGTSYPVYLLADATELYAQAAKIRHTPRNSPGRPRKPWRIAWEIERGIPQAEV